MAIVIVCPSQRAAQTWADALQQRLPQVPIAVYPQVERPDQVEFALCWKPPKGLFNEWPNLRVAQSLGAGVDHIFDTQTLGPQVAICRIIDPNLSNDMWEYLLAVILGQVRELPRYQQQQRQGQWRPHRYRSLSEVTVSILGLGQIGAHVAQAFADFGFLVQGWSNSPKNFSGIRCYDGRSALSELLKTTDFLINLLPLTPQTKGILNGDVLQQLKAGAYLINVGRGGHLVEADVLALLEEGDLAGATLDVFSHEPLPASHPFWKHPKIQLTPHVASLTNINSSIKQIVANYQRYRDGKALLNQVTKAKGY